MTEFIFELIGYVGLFALGVLIGRSTMEEELSEESQKQQDALESVYNAPAEVPAPVKRGRGRPRKNPVA